MNAYMVNGHGQHWMDPVEAGILYGDDIERHLDKIHPDERPLAIATGHSKV